MKKNFIGLDIGGTKIEGILVSLEAGNRKLETGGRKLVIDGEDYSICSQIRKDSPVNSPYFVVVTEIAELIKDCLEVESLKVDDVGGIGIGLPGTVHPISQQMLNGNSPVFIDRDFSGDLGSELGFDGVINIHNDANCFAMAEIYQGAGLQYEKDFHVPPSEQIAVGVILGTGVGGGVSIKGQLLTGKDGGASELGHTQLLNEGPVCYCGQVGCAEEFLSGPGLSRLSGSDMTAVEIFDDPEKFQLLITTYKENLAQFLTNLTNTFNPHYFVLGGGVSKAAVIYDGLEEAIAKRAFLKKSTAKVYQHQWGDSAGVVGAIMCSFEQFKKFQGPSS
jgi:fructokinase